MAKNITGRVRLSIDFNNAEDLLEWVSDVAQSGGFGNIPVTEFPHLNSPRQDIGVRMLDSIDTERVGTDNQFIVASTKDPGRFLETIEISRTTCSLKSIYES